MKRNVVLVLLMLAACARTENERIELPDETRDGVLYTLASLFQIEYAKIQLNRAEEVTWPSACLGIAMRGPCETGEVPGYRFLVTIDGQDYEYRSSKANPLELLLAESPTPEIDDPRLVWEDDVQLFASEGEAGRCVSLRISEDGIGSVGYCGAPHLTRPLLGPMDRPDQWTYFLHRFAPFTYEAGNQRLTFQGQGAEEASPAWQRALAAWAEIVHAEQASGRSAASWGTAFAWQQAADQEGYCDYLTVQNYALVQASRALCGGGNGTALGDGFLSDAEWTTFDRWNTTYAARDTANVHFFGTGERPMPADTVAALDRWARDLFNRLAEASQP